jgi:hypothetical protein
VSAAVPEVFGAADGCGEAEEGTLPSTGIGDMALQMVFI